MTRKRSRDRRSYRAPEPSRRAGSGLPLLPLSVAGLGIGLLVVAFVALSNQPAAPTPPPLGTMSLASPYVTFPAENADGSLGEAGAPLVIQEWADYQCPACRSYAQQVEPPLVDQYVRQGKVRLVFHDFAFIGAESFAAATAAQCAAEQRRFWPYHGYLYANQGSRENGGTYSEAMLRQVAAVVGLDMDRFDACRTGGAAEQRVRASTAQAQSLGFSSTPTIVVANQAPIEGVPGWAQFQAYIDGLLAAAGF